MYSVVYTSTALSVPSRILVQVYSVLSSMRRYIKCGCKHDYDEHDVRGRHKCKRCNCSAFAPTQSCPCGHPHRDHYTVYESRDERVADGRPVAGAWIQPTQRLGWYVSMWAGIAGSEGAGYAGLGGVTDFSSLVDGCDRLGPGAGAQLGLGPGNWHAVDSRTLQGPPTAQMLQAAPSSIVEDQIYEFYAKHNPEKIEDGTMERLLQKFSGREHELLRNIKKKYAPKKPKQEWASVVVPSQREWVDEPVNQSGMHQAQMPAEPPMDEMEMYHAQYDAKYGKPRRR